MTDPTPEISKSDSSTDSSRTVKFNVGGRHYEVSRSLIERFPETMLAKMVSETWQKDPEATLFIDENGDRFQYCLDYMRRKEVWIPLSVPKEALLQDLDYYGFENVDPGKIYGGSSNLAAALHLIKCKKEHEKVLSTCVENVEAAEATCRENVKATKTTSKCEEVAYECFVRFSQGKSLKMGFRSNKEPKLYSSAEVAVTNPAELQDQLAKYGLAFVESEFKSDRRDWNEYEYLLTLNTIN
jgi:hypothetical protein